MTIFYVDTSALMKRYLPETGSSWINGMLGQAAFDTFSSSDLVSVELIAEIARAHREKRISRTRRDALAVQIAQEWKILLVPAAVTGRVITTANTLALRYPLRAYDAIHLATALLARGDGQVSGLDAPIFLSADKTLLAAAKAEGFTTDDPNDHP